jgi:hypothetical protein
VNDQYDYGFDDGGRPNGCRGVLNGLALTAALVIVLAVLVLLAMLWWPL